MKRLLVLAACVAFTFFVILTVRAAPSTETVISLPTGLKIGGTATDRLGFYDATPTPKPILTSVTTTTLANGLAALGLLATATPTATASSTATATATATATPTP